MTYSQKINNIMVLKGEGLLEEGQAPGLFEQIRNDLDKVQNTVAKCEDAVRSKREERDVVINQIKAKNVALDRLKRNQDAASADGEKTDQAVRNTREAFNERRDTASEEDFDRFNVEIAQLQERAERNAEAVATLQNQIITTKQNIADLKTNLAEINQSLTRLETTHTKEFWALLDAADTLSAQLTETVRGQLDRILPADKGVDHFLVVSDTGHLHDADDVITSLQQEQGPQAGNAYARKMHLKLNKIELETRIQHLLDHMTSRRIAEERDTEVYVQRLNLAFRRVEEEARKQQKMLLGETYTDTQDQTEGHDNSEKTRGTLLECHDVKARLMWLDKVAQHLDENVLDPTNPPSNPNRPSKAGGAQHKQSSEHTIRARAKQTAMVTQNSDEFARQVEIFLDRSHQSLGNLVNHFCSKPIVDAATAQSISVSRAAEISSVFRIRPLFWAAFITFVVKIILAHSPAIVMHENASMILLSTFVATWSMSILFGRKNRDRRMVHLQKETRAAFDNLTNPTNETAKRRYWSPLAWFRNQFGNPLAEGKTIRFTPEAFDQIEAKAGGKTEVRPFDTRMSLRQEKQGLFLQNAVLICIPAAMAFATYSADSGYRTYVSKLQNGQACTLMSGRLTAANETNFYLHVPEELTKEGRVHEIRHLITRITFPEVLSKAVARDQVVDVLTGKDDIPRRRCAEGVKLVESDFHAPNKVFPALFRAQIVRAQSLLRKIVVNGDVSASTQHKFSALLEDIKSQLGPKATDVQAVRLVMSGFLHSPKSAPPAVGTNTAQDTYVYNEVSAQLTGADKVADAITALRQDPNLDLDKALEEAKLRMDGLQEFAKFIAIAVQSNAELSKAVQENTKVINTLGEGANGGPILASIVTEGSTVQVTLPEVPPTLILTPTVRMAQAQVEQPNTLVTHFTLPEPYIAKHSIENALFMPFFPDPVQTGSMANPIEAYRFGLSNAGFKPPQDSSSGKLGRDYFSTVAQALKSCVGAESDKMITLDIQGHASMSWTGEVTPPNTKEVLNHHLAEGRRMGVLMRLKSEIPEARTQAKIMIYNPSGNTSLSSFQQIDSGTPDPIFEVPFKTAFEKRRFLKPMHMRNSQKGWLSTVNLTDSKTGNALQEIFARTVIIEIRNYQGTSCTFSPTKVTEQANVQSTSGGSLTKSQLE